MTILDKSEMNNEITIKFYILLSLNSFLNRFFSRVILSLFMKIFTVLSVIVYCFDLHFVFNCYKVKVSTVLFNHFVPFNQN